MECGEGMHEMDERRRERSSSSQNRLALACILNRYQCVSGKFAINFVISRFDPDLSTCICHRCERDVIFTISVTIDDGLKVEQCLRISLSAKELNYCDLRYESTFSTSLTSYEGSEPLGENFHLSRNSRIEGLDWNSNQST